MPGSSHVFSEIYIHVNWHCLHNRPMIQPNVEEPLFRFITEHCQKVKGVHLIALNGTVDHVHIAFQVEPFVTISEFIGKLKGSSSHEINKKFGRKLLLWQRGYGTVSFSKRQGRVIIEYIKRQKEHHSSNTGLNQTLEMCDAYDDGHDAKAVDKPR